MEFHKKQLLKFKVNFIKPDNLRKNDFNKNTLDFLKKVNNFENFIKAFINLTKGKTYGK